MVKYTVWNDGKFNNGNPCENTKFTRELNTYAVDENGIGEELLFPIRLNGEPGENQETNLATYLIKYKEFEKNEVKIIKDQDKEGFLIFIHSTKPINLNLAIILTSKLATLLKTDFEGTVCVK